MRKLKCNKVKGLALDLMGGWEYPMSEPTTVSLPLANVNTTTNTVTSAVLWTGCNITFVYGDSFPLWGS